MRIDPNRNQDFQQSDVWQHVQLELNAFQPVDPDDRTKGSVAQPFSGNERNRMFLQTSDNFDDVSLVSGADTKADGRGFVLFDFDRDGWIDMGITSPLQPRFQILKNRFNLLDQTNASAFVRLQGGNVDAKPTNEFSNRDGIGAKLKVKIADTARAYVRSCGEGLASQNSSWMHISLGQADSIDEIRVLWPSGKETIHRDINAGERVTLFEIETAARQ